jgi:hypothetical protein
MLSVLRKIAFSVVCCHLLLPASGFAASCAASLGSLNGWYGMLVAGSTVGASVAPKYLTGALLFNGAGSISALHVYSGAAVDSAATGTYVVNADCTVTITLTVGGGTPQVFTVALRQSKQAVGIETDASAVATIDLQPQYATVTTGLNFTGSSLNGTFAASCSGPAGSYTDLNLATFKSGALAGTDPYNNGGTYQVSNNPYSGTYTVNSDGTFSGSLTVDGTNFDFYGVISNVNAKVEYIYSGTANGAATAAFASCVGKLAAPITF